MRHPAAVVPALLAALAAASGCRAAPDAAAHELATLRAQLLQRARQDQDARGRPLPANGAQRQAAIARIVAVDEDNTAWLRGVVATHGWPTRSMVGADGAHAAWLLLQHADRDRAFQQRMLPRLQQLAAAGEVDPSDAAYLTDRVCIARGEPQVYGTQYPPPDAGTAGQRPPRVVDPAGLDARRAAVGLGPWREYEALMARLQQREPFAAPRGPGEP